VEGRREAKEGTGDPGPDIVIFRASVKLSALMNTKFAPIEAVLADLRKGRMVLVVDDADRENEGDLIFAAEKATPQQVGFMVRHTSGVICVPLPGAELDRLQLPLMTQQNRERMRTAYTISVDAADGVSTGISAADRARTIRLLANPQTQPDELVRPGHVFPLRYREGGVLRRAGHTEAAVDLVRLAGLQPAGVLAQVVNDDGTMARLPQLVKFAKKHKLKLCTTASLIEYRRSREKLVAAVEVIKLPTDYGDFNLHLYRSELDGEHHLALVRGEVAGKRDVLVRVRFPAQRDRDAVAHGHAAGGGGRVRGDFVHAAGRPGHRADTGKSDGQITGARG